MPPYENITKLEEGLWLVRFAYVDPLTGTLRRVKRRIHGTLAEAIVARERLLTVAKGGVSAIAEEKVSKHAVRDMVADYFTHITTRRKPIKESQRRNNLILWQSRIEPAIGSWVVGEIKRSDLKRLLEGWGEEKKANGDFYTLGTVRQWRAFTTSLLTYCFGKAGREDLHVLKDHKLPDEELREKPGRAMTRAEAKTLLDHLYESAPFWFAFAFVALATGQRFGSVSALRWVDVREDAIIFATSQHSGVTRKGNKSGKVISIPISPDLREVLDAHRDYQDAIPNCHKALGLVFPALTKRGQGGCLDVSTLRYALRKACGALGLEPVNPHDLRRTSNSWLVEAGIPGPLIRDMIGHSDISLTDRYYRASEVVQRDAAQILVSALKSKG